MGEESITKMGLEDKKNTLQEGSFSGGGEKRILFIYQGLNPVIFYLLNSLISLTFERMTVSFGTISVK